MNYTVKALGSVIRERREAAGLTQVQLGEAAGYKGGAGVAVSRIENGLAQPSREYLEGINTALGLFPGEIVLLAASRTEELAREGGQRRASGRTTGNAHESLRDRAQRLQQTMELRTAQLTKVVDSFNEAHDAARDHFLLPFVRTADAVAGAPRPPQGDLDDALPSEGAGAEETAEFRLRLATFGVAQALSNAAAGAAVGAAVGGAAGAAASYAAFTAAVTWGTASTGAAISSLAGVAASNAALAALGGGALAAGGAGMAGGAALLTGLAAGPAVLLALGGIVWATRRNRRQQEELTTKLDAVESDLLDQAPGMQAFLDLVSRAAGTLNHLAVHGAHAQERWAKRLGTPTTWEQLSAGQREQYDDFVHLCAAQVAVASLDPQRLLALRGAELDEEIALMDQILEKSDDLARRV